jgi:hypothetical protein
MCVFSVKQQVPVYYRLLPDNIKNISAFKICLQESGVKDATVIIDKGFVSMNNIEALVFVVLGIYNPEKRTDTTNVFLGSSTHYANVYVCNTSFLLRAICCVHLDNFPIEPTNYSNCQQILLSFVLPALLSVCLFATRI